MVRRLVYILAAACAILLAVVTLKKPAPTAAASTHTAGIDWTHVTSHDLNIAAVFLTARDVGLRQALDSLQALAAHDPELSGDGHMLAHALGRAAITRHNDLPAVIAQCRPIFEAGCYHGVMEGFLITQKSLDSSSVAAICSAVERSSTDRQPMLECSHGLGHGLLERFGYDLPRALGACDDLAAADARGECHDGVFMENASHGLGDQMIAVGDAALAAHQHMMQMEGEHTNREYFRKQDLAFPCDSVAAPYQSSCWSYQPLAVIQLTRADIQKTLRACDLAAGDGQRTCYRGFGKQSTSWYGDRAPDIVKTCRQATPPHVADCLGGVVETYVDYDWTADRAIAFCRAVPGALKAGCYAEVGARMGTIRTDSASLAADCRGAESAFVAACVREGIAAERRPAQS